MKELKEIPEFWTCLARNTHQDMVLTDYFTDNYGSIADYDPNCEGDCWFINQKNAIGNYYEFRRHEEKNTPPKGFTPITFEFFERHILNNEPLYSEKENLEELEVIYKKLLNL